MQSRDVFVEGIVTYRILLVDTDATSAALAKHLLSSAGYRVAQVSAFGEASRQLIEDHPDLLITKLRLGAFNGLHLILRAHAVDPTLPAILIGALTDYMADVERYGARFVSSPFDDAALLALVSEMLTGRVPRDPGGARVWKRKRADLPATIHEKCARVIELSYGGIRLEMDDLPADFRDPIDVDFPTFHMSVTAVVRWKAAAGQGGPWRCGAEIALAGETAVQQWRGLVDSFH